MAQQSAFVREIELWSPQRGHDWRRTTTGPAGQSEEQVTIHGTAQGTARLVRRVLSTQRPELDSEDRETVVVAFPLFHAQRLSTVVVLRCHSETGRGGCVEVWEPSQNAELVHAEGYYGVLGDFEMSSRLARFRRGIGLPGITWDRHRPHIIDDLRYSPHFLRAALAREHALAVGLGVPIVRQNEVEHVLVFLTAQRSPPARAIEIWIPDAQGRLWLDHGAYDTGLEALGRASRTTCLMPGEGVAGRAAKAGEPLLWSRQSKQNDATDSDAARAGLALGIALPLVESTGTRAVLVLRS
ncbi:MAG: hypothetical protein IPH72_02475 [Sandaracinaceae bacterium]|nr:hypothetical protein [Sandaracinaceae bacterium]